MKEINVLDEEGEEGDDTTPVLLAAGGVNGRAKGLAVYREVADWIHKRLQY